MTDILLGIVGGLCIAYAIPKWADWLVDRLDVDEELIPSHDGRPRLRWYDRAGHTGVELWQRRKEDQQR